MKIYQHTPLIFRNIYGIMSRDMTTKGQFPERQDTMRIETETAVRSIVGFDSEVTKEMVERAIDILRGKADADGGEITVHNVRFSDAMEILKVKRRTLRHYIYRGYLDRVYGGGCRAIGVTRESLLRFMTHRTVEHRGEGGITVTHGKACVTPGRSWARELK